MFYFNALLLTIVVIFIVDISGFVETVKPAVNKLLRRDQFERLRPFDCSLCMVFWTGLTYTLLTGFSFPHLAFVCLCAFSARFISDTIFTVDTLLAKLIHTINDKIDRL